MYCWFFLLSLEIPRSPKSFSVKNAQKKYLILTWEEPEYGSIYQIHNYTIERKISRLKNFTAVWTIPYPETRMIMENLDPSTEYIIRLSSNNMYGRSEGVLLTQKTLPGNNNTQSGFLPKWPAPRRSLHINRYLPKGNYLKIHEVREKVKVNNNN